MKKFLYLFLFFLLTNCFSGKKVYWCGDHPCINKKERAAYFKKTMTVEVKEFNKKKDKNNSEIEKLIQQAKIDEKNRIINEKQLLKQAKIKEKKRLKEEKAAAKLERLKEKDRIKYEKELKKQAKIKEKKLKKEAKKEKKMVKKIETNKKNIKDSKKQKINKKKESYNESKNSNFKNIVENIFKRNKNKSYPDINNTPN